MDDSLTSLARRMRPFLTQVIQQKIDHHFHTWTEIEDKPLTFPPSVHNHAWADITSGIPALAQTDLANSFTKAQTVQPDTDVLALLVKGNAGGAGALLQLQKSDASVLATFDKGGYLGIGVSPVYPLDVIAATAVYPARFRKDGTGMTGSNRFYNGDSTDNNGAQLAFSSDTTGVGATADSSLVFLNGRAAVHDHATRSGEFYVSHYVSGTLKTGFMLDAADNFGIGITAPGAKLHADLVDAGTNALADVAILEHDSSQATAANFGGTLRLRLRDSGNQHVDAGTLDWLWATASPTANRKARMVFSVLDTAAREGLRIEASGTAAMLGFFGVGAVVRPSAYTQTYATASKTMAATTQLAAPAGGTGATAGAYDTAAHRDAAITSINAARADIDNLKQVVTQMIDDLQALGILS